MTSAPNEMTLADARRLLTLGETLLGEAYKLPEPAAPVAITGTDPLSRAIAAQVAGVVVCSAKERMIKDAQDLIDIATAVLGNSIGKGAAE